MNDQRQITHQTFIEHGKITGVPNNWSGKKNKL
jgi:hypothetical protein